MTILYGISNCDTVKKARRWLDEHGVSYRFHDFRVDGLDSEQVQVWLAELGTDTVINKRSTTWKQLDAQRKESLDVDSAERLILEHPTLIKRPLLESGSTRMVGFDAERYAALFRS